MSPVDSSFRQQQKMRRFKYYAPIDNELALSISPVSMGFETMEIHNMITIEGSRMKGMAMIVAVMATLVLAISGCAGPQYSGKKPELVQEGIAEYKIGVGDQLAVQVWKSPELSVNVPVRPDGRISVPLIGDVVAQGQTTMGLSAGLTEGFEKYVRNPQVTVIVLNPTSADFLRRVRVTGAVAQPLSVAHQQGMTVMDIVLLAGGLTEFASANKARLYRKVGDKVNVYPIYLDAILNNGDVETNYVLAPSDIVTVPERKF